MAEPLLVWPTATGFLHAQVGGRLHRKKLTHQQMFWMAAEFLKAGNEMLADAQRAEFDNFEDIERAARKTTANLEE
tara:strand:+ start:93 stop:320 length:228 start_codon:yes stop_codon:yes gene_type:complete